MLSVISNKKAWIWSEWSVAVVLLSSCGWGGQRTGADQWSVDIMGIIIRQMRPSRHWRGAGGCNHGQHSVTVRTSPDPALVIALCLARNRLYRRGWTLDTGHCRTLNLPQPVFSCSPLTVMHRHNTGCSNCPSSSASNEGYPKVRNHGPSPG